MYLKIKIKKQNKLEDEKENAVKNKKIYSEPELCFIVLQPVDIISTSPETDGWEDGNVKDDGWL